MRIATRGLHCIPLKLRRRPDYNPYHRAFRPELIIRYLKKYGAPPCESLEDFARWIWRSTKHHSLFVLAKPVRIDVPIIQAYFEKYALP